jgi:hypothetical protein
MRSSHQLLLSSTILSLLTLLGLAKLAESTIPLRPAATGPFIDSGQSLGNATTNGISAGDVDGDGDIDLFTANTVANVVYRNDGAATFADSLQRLGAESSNAVALGDVDKDNDLDALVANKATNQLWLNDGSGAFSQGAQLGISVSESLGVALGDLDGDNDLDAFFANVGANQVFLNGEEGDPVGTFRDSGQRLGSANSKAVALGDVDGDADLDAIVANGSGSFEPSTVWLNQGGLQGGVPGEFADSGNPLDGSWNSDVELGDLDGDNDLDIVFSSWFGDGSIWLNQGGNQLGVAGQFSATLQTPAGTGSLGIALADIDGDSDLDLVVARYSIPDELWLNQGGIQLGQQGVFSLTQTLSSAASYSVEVADFDGDKDADVAFGAFGGNQIWLNCGDPLRASFSVDARSNSAGRFTYPWALPGDASLPVTLGCPPTRPVTVSARVKSIADVITETIPFAIGERTNDLVVSNPSPSPSATFTLSLGVDLGVLSRAKLPVLQIGRMHLVFVDPGQGETSCTLCFIDWLLKLLGFHTSFWMLHHVELPGLVSSLSWGYYSDLFKANSQELATIIATHPSLLWKSLDVLEATTPLVQALGQGEGDLAVVSQELEDDVMELLQGIQDEAGPELAARIQIEMDVLDLDSFAGKDMNEVANQLEQRIAGDVYLPMVVSPAP